MKPAAPVTKTAFGMFSRLLAAMPRNEATSSLAISGANPKDFAGT